MPTQMAHATAMDVQSGKTTAFDKWGDDHADALAVSGASSHPLRFDREKRFKTLRAVMDVQKMMLDILSSSEARRTQQGVSSRPAKATAADVVEISSAEDFVELRSDDAWSDLDV